jgi:tagatose-1,6-bisphosphate aldolase non-catalytic subunit AgaZ/GatZ
VGTDLHTSLFNPGTAGKVVSIARQYGSYIKGHYTDSVSNPRDYPASGMGGANVGPEFSIAEFEAFNELASIEYALYKENRIACPSRLKEKLTTAVTRSGRWRKWLLEGETELESLTQKRKDWILGTCSRYVWAEPEVKCSIQDLHNNLGQNGIDSRTWVTGKIEAVMDKYFMAFNLIDINKKISEILDKEGL